MKKPIILFLAALAVVIAVSAFYILTMKAPKSAAGNEPVGRKINVREITLYYYNPHADMDESGNVLCSRAGLVPLAREIPLTKTPIQDTLHLLLKGDLTASEKQAGITTEFPLPGLVLKGAALAGGILTLEFDDAQNKTSGGSCRAGVLWFQIEATAKQVAGVERVRFVPETLFQP
jgi:hypothetical protein